MTFDLKLWPIRLNINRDQVISNYYLGTRFEPSETKNS